VPPREVALVALANVDHQHAWTTHQPGQIPICFDYRDPRIGDDRGRVSEATNSSQEALLIGRAEHAIR
jgi:hypothetical protein